MRVLKLADEEAMRIGALLEFHEDAGVRAHAAWLRDPDWFRLASLIEAYRKAGWKATSDGTGAVAAAIKELGLEAQISEEHAFRMWKRYYPPVKLPDKPAAGAQARAKRPRRTP